LPNGSERPGWRRAQLERRWNYAGIVLLVTALCLGPLIVTNSYYRYAGVLMVMYMVMSSSWNLVGGFTGYVSLGHAAFFGFGAYSTGLIANDSQLSVVLALAATLGICVAAGAAVGAVALRVRGASFVIVTIALVYMGSLLAQGLRSVTGGSRGLNVAPLFTFGGRAARHAAYIVTFALLLAVVLALWNFIDGSKFGIGLKAVREDEDRAQSLGVNTTAFKVVIFAVSTGFVGVAGGLYATWTRFIDPIFVFSVQISAQLVLMALLGGTRSLWGPVLGAAVIVPGGEYLLINIPDYHVLSMGVLLAAVVLLMPNGVIPSVRSVVAWRQPPVASIREGGGTVLDDATGVVGESHRRGAAPTSSAAGRPR
jgi:branched-chain amino acid transport system permease protein